MAQNLILFTTSTSAVCGKLEQYLNQNSVGVIKVYLDTERDRKRAANGVSFKIHSVPTLAVMMGDNVKLFVGAEHIVKWLSEAARQRVSSAPSGMPSGMPYQPSQNYPRSQTMHSQQEVSEFEPELSVETPLPKKVKRKKQKKPRKEKLEIETNVNEEMKPSKTYSKPISGLQVGEAAIPKYKSQVNMTVEQMKREREATNKQFNWTDEFGSQA